MHINFIISKLPTKEQLDQIFLSFGIDKYTLLENHDWEIIPENTEVIMNISQTNDKKWQYDLQLIMKQDGDEQWFYYSLIKAFADITPCDVICCCYNHEISGLPDECQNDPYYDFAYIDGHWYCIDDVNANYANDDVEKGDIIIINSIHETMERFLIFGNISKT